MGPLIPQLTRPAFILLAGCDLKPIAVLVGHVQLRRSCRSLFVFVFLFVIGLFVYLSVFLSVCLFAFVCLFVWLAWLFGVCIALLVCICFDSLFDRMHSDSLPVPFLY